MKSPHQASFGRGLILWMSLLALGMVASLLGLGYASWLRLHRLERPVALTLLDAVHDRKVNQIEDLKFFKFDSTRMEVSRLAEKTPLARYEIKTHDPSMSILFGMALVRDIAVDETGVLEITWQAKNATNRLSLNVIEHAKPERPRGAVFTHEVEPLDGETWNHTRIPLTTFTVANAQDMANVGSRNTLDPRNLGQLDLVIFPGPDFVLQIQRIVVSWDPCRRWILACTGLLGLALLTLLPSGFGERLLHQPFSKGLLSPAIASRLSLMLTLAYWSITIGQGRDPGTQNASTALAIGTIAASLPGAFGFLPIVRHRLWGIRNLLVWGIAIALGLNLNALAALVATLVILLPSLESRDARVFTVNALGVAIGLFATLPFEIAGNRILPALVASGMVASAVIFMQQIGFSRTKGSTASVLKLYEGLFHHSPDAIFVCDRQFRLQTVNPGLVSLTGYEKTELEHMSLQQLLHPLDVPLLEAEWMTEEESRSLVLRFLTHHGQKFTLTRIQQLREQDQHYGFQAIAADITREKELEEALRTTNERLFNLSRQDALTGVANRRAFDERLKEEWMRAQRHRTALAVVLVDIDFFKGYNDTYGHQGGDVCLQQVAQALAGFGRRGGELLARYGGEEFAFILPQLSREELQQLCNQVLAVIDALQIPHGASRVASHITVSMGAARSTGGEGTIEGLIAEADEALYRAKAQGRHRALLSS